VFTAWFSVTVAWMIAMIDVVIVVCDADAAVGPADELC